MKRVFALLSVTIWVVVLVGVRAEASCTCQCVDGEVQPLCSSSMENPPICPPRICPIAAPAIAPIQLPTIPPLGTSSCRQAHVCDFYGDCRWQQVCQ
jgi:hypothetical protein